MFDSKKLSYIAFGLIVVAASSYVGNHFRHYFTEMDAKDDYKMVKKYLLDEAALYGDKRPKLWIHTKYEVNAREWKNFGSRNSSNLNQPYLYITIQSIINHCGDAFHICLIDDETFERLIPTWDIQLHTTPEPMRSHYRDIGMMQLLYLYGGMIVPNSFLCLRSLKPLYDMNIEENVPFVIEQRKQKSFSNLGVHSTPNTPFIPNIKMMGAAPKSACIQEMIEMMSDKQQKGHFSSEIDFLGTIEQWCLTQVQDDYMIMVDGCTVGVKDKIGKPILLDNLMSDDFLAVNESDMYGILIPSEELLHRPHYQWFSILPYKDALAAKTILSKYMSSSMVDSVRSVYDQNKSSTSMIKL